MAFPTIVEVEGTLTSWRAARPTNRGSRCKSFSKASNPDGLRSKPLPQPKSGERGREIFDEYRRALSPDAPGAEEAA